MIAIGGTNIVKAYLGSTELANIAIGDELLLSSEPAPLPYDAAIEYLESTGTQWIDTGIKASQNISVTIDFVRTDNTATFSHLFGWRYYKQSPGRRCCFAFLVKISSKNNYWAVEVGRSTSSSDAEIPINTPATATMAWGAATVVCGGNTKTINYSPTWDSGITIDNMFLFSRNGISSDSAVPFIGRVSACQIQSSGTLVRDFVSVRVGTTGYMYDKISGTLFGNAGTGDFVLGNDIT